MAMKFEINLSALSQQDSYVRMCPATQTTETVHLSAKRPSSSIDEAKSRSNRSQMMLCYVVFCGSIRALADTTLPRILARPQSAQTAMLKQMQMHMSALENKIAHLARTVLELRKLKTEAEKDLQSKLVFHPSTTLLVLILASPFAIRTNACSRHLLSRGCCATT